MFSKYTTKINFQKLLVPGLATVLVLSSFGIVASAQSDPLFIGKDKITLSPNPSTGLSVFGDRDYTFTVKDDRIVASGSAANCTFRIKELSSPTDDNADRGYDKLTSTILSPHNNAGSYNTTSKLFEVTYATTGTQGASIKIAKDKQKYSDYNLQVRCKRTSDNQIFATDQRVNFLFGAYAAVGITGVVVP